MVKEKINIERIAVGWREWLALPELNIPAIKAKIDTGARTSALHAVNLETFSERGVRKVKFDVHPLQRSTYPEISCIADVIDERIIADSGGHREKRIVIQTVLKIVESEWLIEMTLTNREDMKFRMLLGREAIRKRVMVYPDKSYLTGKLKAKYYSH
jgi:hypothetical protein